MFVEYVLRGRRSVRGAKSVIERNILDVEDERDKGEDPCCNGFRVRKLPGGTVHIYLEGVTSNWQPGKFYERMLRDRLLEEGCELELVRTTP